MYLSRASLVYIGRFGYFVSKVVWAYAYLRAYDQGEPQTDEAAGRVSLEWDASDDLLISVKVEHGDWDNNGMSYDQQIGDLAPVYGAVVALVGRNLTDEDYITYSNDMPLFAGNQQVAWGREASYGLRGRVRF